ncbi:MAG: hypothetical protein Tsb0014_12380 [Pleurocapsa sp.]
MAKYQKSSFTLVGKLKKIVYKKGKIKYLKVVKDDRDRYWIKVSSKLQENLDTHLTKNCRLEVRGQQKQNLKTGKTKYKALGVVLMPKTPETRVKEKEVSLLPVFDSDKKSKAKVLICQKSNCWKRGGKEICEQLTANLSDRSLASDIPIKKTGCLKKCKQAPNIVMLPDKVRYSNVKAKQIPNLVDKHLVV